MKCPRDHSEMRTGRHKAGFEIDTCPTCSGVWLDKGELEAVKDRVEHDMKPGKLKVPKNFDFSFSRRMQGTQGQVGCPRCGATMDVKEYAGWSEILTDVCPDGCGLWLDKNELKALEVFFAQNLGRSGKESASEAAMWSSLVDLFGG